MDLTRLIEALSDKSVYPHPVEQVEVRHTHVSVVFLAGPYVYKIKKPVNLGFLDFSSLARRRHYCEEEVRLNRRLAADVYLGVVPITYADNQILVEGPGQVIEWGVKMQRLPDEATLLQRLLRGDIGNDHVVALARRIAAFHAHADRNESISAFGRFDVVAANVRENFKQSALQVGSTVSPAVFQRVQALTEASLKQLRPLIEARAERGVPRDTHGDLHLDHVYLFPERSPPADLVVIDCIEFNERFRFSDPIADMAFVAMDLAFHARRDLAHSFSEAYFDASGDEEGRALLAFYAVYRAVVRAKVEGLKAAESEVSPTEQERALQQARAHWLLALVKLEAPRRKPCLVLTGGLPGSGKSTLARGLAEQSDVKVIRSDVVRKELARISAQDASEHGSIYTAEWTDRTYAECLRRAEKIVMDGGRALVDASFIDESRRRVFLDAADSWGVPAIFFVCNTDPDTARCRLEARRDDASDADWSIRQLAARRWEEPGTRTKRALYEVANQGTAQEALEVALGHLRMLGLLSEPEARATR